LICACWTQAIIARGRTRSAATSRGVIASLASAIDYSQLFPTDLNVGHRRHLLFWLIHRSTSLIDRYPIAKSASLLIDTSGPACAVHGPKVPINCDAVAKSAILLIDRVMSEPAFTPHRPKVPTDCDEVAKALVLVPPPQRRRYGVLVSIKVDDARGEPWGAISKRKHWCSCHFLCLPTRSRLGILRRYRLAIIIVLNRFSKGSERDAPAPEESRDGRNRYQGEVGKY
jgi:hypothetical protein